jgi:hypothetical protein
MQDRKGAAIALVSVITGVFIMSGSIFGGIMTNSQISQTVNYSTGHITQLMEAQTKKNIYMENMEKELRYVQNNNAFWNNETVWENDIPEHEEIRDRFKDQLISGDYNLPDQNRILRCTPPTIEKEDIEILSNTQMKLNLADEEVTCYGGDSTAFIPIKENIQVENEANNYLNLLEYGKSLASEVNEEVNTVEGEEISVETGCIEAENSEDKGRRQAVSKAKSEILGDRKDLAQTIYDETESRRESFIELKNSETFINGSKSVELDSNECGDSGEKFSGTVEFTPDTLTTRYMLEDSENKVITYQGRERVKTEIAYEMELE